MNRTSLLLALLFATPLLPACSDESAGTPPEDTGPAVIQLSYEAIPGDGVVLSNGMAYDLSASDATYDEKEAFTRDVLDTLVPEVLDALGVPAAELETSLTPGGYLLETNPSIQSRSRAGAQTSTALAAALGYAFHEWSVLVTDFSDSDGGTGFVTVRFPDGALTPAQAQAFFEHAAGVDPGLGGGYTAFDDDMIFLNLRDDSGAPYSGLEDPAFLDLMNDAAGTFQGASAGVADSGEVRAALVESAWDAAAPGDDYLAKIPDAAEITADLQAVQAQHTDMFVQALQTYGW